MLRLLSAITQIKRSRRSDAMLALIVSNWISSWGTSREHSVQMTAVFLIMVRASLMKSRDFSRTKTYASCPRIMMSPVTLLSIPRAIIDPRKSLCERLSANFKDFGEIFKTLIGRAAGSSLVAPKMAIFRMHESLPPHIKNLSVPSSPLMDKTMSCSSGVRKSEKVRQPHASACLESSSILFLKNSDSLSMLMEVS